MTRPARGARACVAGYGGGTVLHGVDLTVEQGGRVAAARPQRRRQVDPAEAAVMGLLRPDRRQRPPRRPRPRRPPQPTDRPRRRRPRAAGPPRVRRPLTVDENLALSPPPAAAPARGHAAACLRAPPPARRAPPSPRRPALRRRAADARRRPGAADRTRACCCSTSPPTASPRPWSPRSATCWPTSAKGVAVLLVEQDLRTGVHRRRRRSPSWPRARSSTPPRCTNSDAIARMPSGCWASVST